MDSKDRFSRVLENALRTPSGKKNSGHKRSSSAVSAKSRMLDKGNSGKGSLLAAGDAITSPDTGGASPIYSRHRRSLSYSATTPHHFAPYSEFYPAFCAVCDKTLWSWYKHGLKCEVCGMCIHDGCLSLAGDLLCKRKEKDGVNLSNSLSSLGPSTPGVGIDKADDQKTSVVCKSSLYFIKRRLEHEAIYPAVKDDAYQRAIKNYICEFLKHAEKYIKDKAFSCGDFEVVFLETILNAPDAASSAVQTNDIYFAAFRASLYDSKFYAAMPVDYVHIAAQDIASQLTVLDSVLYNRITREECYDQAWMKKNKHERAPNIMAFIERFNQVSLFVITAILEAAMPKGRAALIQHFVNVAHACLQMMNFNSLMAILAGLQSTPIHRLKKSWTSVSTRVRDRFERLAQQMSTESNSEEYRELLASCAAKSGAVCVPHLGMFLTDLTYINAAFSKVPEQLKLKTDEVIVQIEFYQSGQSRLQSIFGLEDHFLNLKYDDEDVSYTRSLEREPIEEPKQRTVPSDIAHSTEKSGSTDAINTTDVLVVPSTFDETSSPETIATALQQYNARLEGLQSDISGFYKDGQRLESGQLTPRSRHALSSSIDGKTEEMWSLQTMITHIKRQLRLAQRAQRARHTANDVNNRSDNATPSSKDDQQQPLKESERCDTTTDMVEGHTPARSPSDSFLSRHSTSSFVQEPCKSQPTVMSTSKSMPPKPPFYTGNVRSVIQDCENDVLCDDADGGFVDSEEEWLKGDNAEDKQQHPSLPAPLPQLSSLSLASLSCHSRTSSTDSEVAVATRQADIFRLLNGVSARSALLEDYLSSSRDMESITIARDLNATNLQDINTLITLLRRLVRGVPTLNGKETQL